MILVTTAAPVRSTPVDPDDHTLLLAFAAGRTWAFDALWERHAPPLGRWLRGLCRDDALAEDIVQETFFRLTRAAPDVAPGASVRAWIFTVARNTFLAHRRRHLLSHAHLRAEAERPPVPAADPHQHAVAHESSARLQAALLALPAELHDALVLHAHAGLDARDGAAVLGISYDAYRQRLARARARLRERLDG